MIGSGLGMVAFMRRGDALIGAGSNGFYRSTDNGDSWSFYNAGLINIEAGSFAEHDDLLYGALAKAGGVFLFRSSDDGTTWERIGVVPGAVGIAASGSRLLVSGYTGLMYIDPGTSGVDGPGRPVLMERARITPNPVTTTASLEFLLESSSDVHAALYANDGRHIAQIVDHRLTAGDHRFIIKTDDLPSGMYLCRLIIHGRATMLPVIIAR